MDREKGRRRGPAPFIFVPVGPEALFGIFITTLFHGDFGAFRLKCCGMPLKIAIVGRPNVGKSTLFNRLVGKQMAIVNDRPGVTRDRRYATGQIGDIPLELIDTAGFEDLADLSLEACACGCRRKRPSRNADVAFFVVDALAKAWKRRSIAFFAGNPAQEGQAGSCSSPTRPKAIRRRPLPKRRACWASASRCTCRPNTAKACRISMKRRTKVSAELFEGDFEVLEDEDGEDDDTKPVRIAIIGRPNAGKSTLINKLLGEDRLLVGPEAGITRDSISVDWEYEGRTIRLVDTAGLRRKARVQEKLEKLSTADTIRATSPSSRTVVSSGHG